MKQNIFFINKRLLQEYIDKYANPNRTLDQEIIMGLNALKFWEKKLNLELVLVFEVNNKSHSYPSYFFPTTEQLKEIFDKYILIDTPVDFALAPADDIKKYNAYAFPFQVKTIPLEPTDDLDEVLSDFISEKANKYRDINLTLIINPQLRCDINAEKKLFSIDKLKELLTIREDAVRAIYLFQESSDSVNFLQIWVSPLIKDNN